MSDQDTGKQGWRQNYVAAIVLWGMALTYLLAGFYGTIVRAGRPVTAQTKEYFALFVLFALLAIFYHIFRSAFSYIIGGAYAAFAMVDALKTQHWFNGGAYLFVFVALLLEYQFRFHGFPWDDARTEDEGPSTEDQASAK